ncbi:MAG: diguanylate cyclase [Planctomycetes bacterium]|nr:diguanylate cyclase [Planctomycetota bacterium]
MRILIAEDEAVTRRLLEANLAAWGHTVVSVDNGDDAWAAIENDRNDIGVAVLDLVMPGLSGLDICRRVRSGEARDYIYVIFLTARSGKQAIVEGLEAGADDYVVKPFDPAELRLRINAGARIVELERALREANHDLSIQATTDGLTKTLNRMALLQRLEESLARARRERSALAVLMIDIDHFKQVNDVHGHAAGDQVLIELAQRLRQSCRIYDVLGRYGGEEFVVILPGCGLEEGFYAAEHIRRTVGETPFAIGDKNLNITISAGVASNVNHDELTPLLKASDDALYRAKRNGRNQTAIEGFQLASVTENGDS